ncbi:DUF397 domain-containing protein [Streptomyces sp. NPDC048213]|uniref:DUF397 domain-containing protein n=1 Tax=Streptomyces sp. NPDC048213 TaxID=3160984 RepID=UPI0033F8E12D
MTPNFPTAAELADAQWRTSTYSAPNNECVAVAGLGAWVGLRDTKTPGGPAIAVRGEAFAAAVTALRTGTL